MGDPLIRRYSTPHAGALVAALDGLRGELETALTSPFFDAAPTVYATPITKHALSEAGAVTVTARKRKPECEAVISIEVRCEHVESDPPQDAGRYDVRALGHLTCVDEHGRTERALAVKVDEIKGELRVDMTMLRAELTAALHAIGAPKDS